MIIDTKMRPPESHTHNSYHVFMPTTFMPEMHFKSRVQQKKYNERGDHREKGVRKRRGSYTLEFYPSMRFANRVLPILEISPLFRIIFHLTVSYPLSNTSHPLLSLLKNVCPHMSRDFTELFVKTSKNSTF